MADEERPETGEDSGPSLELPNLKSALGFRRKRKSKDSLAAGSDEPPAGPTEAPTPAASEQPEPATSEAAATDLATPPTEPAAGGTEAPAPAAGPTEAPAAAASEPTEPQTVPPARPEPPRPPAGPEPVTPARPNGPGPLEPGPPLSPGPVGLPETQPDVDPTAVLPAAMEVSDQGGPRRAARSRRLPTLDLPGWLVALVTGAVVGVVLVGLTSASLNACSAMRGTSSCGTPGIVLLLAITVAMVFLGALLLRLAGVSTSGSTSFLGVGLLVVVILGALLPVIFHWWMVIVVPVVAMLTYAASWWLTSTYVEPGERAR